MRATRDSSERTLSGETLNYKMVAMDDFQLSYLRLPSYSGFSFWSCLFYWRFPTLSGLMTIFGVSRDQNTKTLKTHTAYNFLR